MIRLTVPSIDETDIAAVAEVLRSGHLVQGPVVAEFERAIADYVDVRHAIAVSNCTAALHLSLLAAGIGPGDRVAVTAYSWPATANVIRHCGAEPVFIDIDPHTFNMDAAKLESVLRGGVRAVLPVDAFGLMADLPTICALAATYGAVVIEDAACAIGADIDGRRAGTWGIAGCFSFHPRKAITTGEGGVVTTNDPDVARVARSLRNHGLDPDAASPDFIMAGYNLRLTEMQAAMGTVQMGKVERVIGARSALADGYAALLEGSDLQLPTAPPGYRHVYQSYVVLLPRNAAARRPAIIQALRERGVESTIGTYHIPMTTYFRARQGVSPGDYPTTDDVAARALTLPLFEGMAADQQALVADVLLETLALAAASRD